MTRFLLRKALGTLGVLLAISVIVYAVFYIAPGDPAQLACGEKCSPAQVHQVRERLGLDAPVYLQYAHFLQGVVAGRDFSAGTGMMHCPAPCLGISYRSGEQVTDMITARLPVTASLAFGAMVLWLVLGVGTGLVAALRRGRLSERLLTAVTLVGISVPVFVTGLVLLIVLCAQLQWLPFPAYVPLTEDPQQWFWGLLLPWTSLALLESAKYARLTRSSMLETLAEDHIRTFRAYGVSERHLVTRHALRGALTPVIALSALDLGSLFGSAVLTESLFGLPGLGKLLVTSVGLIDLPTVVGLTLVTGFSVVLANVIADVLYAVTDRRVVLT
ncbi:ABC transporter permease [Streptomyces sp. NRRL WC-3742]|uniref:ABC transporter permease n=1 Tax=Streptomyces sp. NRRL WC-3742 TaxID=1463934 RepID=UPI0004CB0157|nr:ABC transporter permease [Streptomyces sp. NRRL WC-3742]